MTDKDLETNIKAQRERARALEEKRGQIGSRLDDLEQAVRDSERLLEEPGAQAPEVQVNHSSAGKSLPRRPTSVEPLDWDTMTSSNTSWLADAGLADIELRDLLTSQQLDELESFSRLGRQRWTASDFLTVGGCAVIGVLATVFDGQIDAAVKHGLGGLKNTELLRGWEKNGTNLAIDYTGEGFGGPGHRVRSAGHDIGRPWEALSQIRSGEFRGIVWDHGQQFTKVVPGYAPHSLPEALVLWLQHLGADLVTTTSLPLPWWSKLYELPQRDMRKLAHELYNPADGYGMNLRSMIISKALPVLTTELIVGVKVHLDAHSVDGEFRRLTPNESLRRQEMLLAGHAATGLASIGKVAILAHAGEGPIALRHLNMPAVARAGYLGFRVAMNYRQRYEERQVPSWEDLLREAPLPWDLNDPAFA